MLSRVDKVDEKVLTHETKVRYYEHSVVSRGPPAPLTIPMFRTAHFAIATRSKDVAVPGSAAREEPHQLTVMFGQMEPGDFRRIFRIPDHIRTVAVGPRKSPMSLNKN